MVLLWSRLWLPLSLVMNGLCKSIVFWLRSSVWWLFSVPYFGEGNGVVSILPWRFSFRCLAAYLQLPRPNGQKGREMLQCAEDIGRGVNWLWRLGSLNSSGIGQRVMRQQNCMLWSIGPASNVVCTFLNCCLVPPFPIPLFIWLFTSYIVSKS